MDLVTWEFDQTPEEDRTDLLLLETEARSFWPRLVAAEWARLARRVHRRTTSWRPSCRPRRPVPCRSHRRALP